MKLHRLFSTTLITCLFLLAGCEASQTTLGNGNPPVNDSGKTNDTGGGSTTTTTTSGGTSSSSQLTDAEISDLLVTKGPWILRATDNPAYNDADNTGIDQHAYIFSFTTSVLGDGLEGFEVAAPINCSFLPTRGAQPFSYQTSANASGGFELSILSQLDGSTITYEASNGGTADSPKLILVSGGYTYEFHQFHGSCAASP
jgi:hypothetical protein